MCGIIGFNFEDRNLINRTNKMLFHRGPDDSGYCIIDGWSFAHRRLCIIDLSKNARQPMFNENSDIILIFNGEIYNFRDLKKELEKNHIFISNSDSEVILHAYEEYGLNFIDKLRGMFAFALYDTNNNKLILARDRLGKKPLYYYWDGENFIFSSELLPILEADFVKRGLSYKALSYYLVFGFVPSPLSIIENICKLPPASMLIFKEDKIDIINYWNPSISFLTNEIDEIAEDIRFLLKDSVRLRMISDVPLGAYLSGGLDSSSIVYLMSTISDQIKTFSVGFDFSLDETRFARTVAEYFNTDHREFILDVDNALELFRTVVHGISEPINDPALIPTYLMSREAKRYIKVVLVGDGGDELFGGYERYKAITVLGSLPRFIRRFGCNFILSGSKYFRYMGDEERKRVKSNLASGDVLKIYLALMSTFLPNELTKLNSKLLFDFTSYNYNFDGLNEVMYFDIKTSLADGLLMKVDSMTMQNSIEARTPYLDHKFVEYSLKIPSKHKVKLFNEKFVLKKAFKNSLPRSIINRKKQGFFVPINDWISGELKSTFEDYLENSFFDKYYIKKLKDRCGNPTLMEAKKIWSIVTFETWKENWSD